MPRTEPNMKKENDSIYKDRKDQSKQINNLHHQNVRSISDTRTSGSMGQSHMSEAYRNFHNRLTLQYKICDQPEDKSIEEIGLRMGMTPGNATQSGLDARRLACCLALPICCLPYVIYYSKSCKFVVPSNQFALVEDHSSRKPETKIYGPGYHFLGLYHYLKKKYTFKKKVANNLIQAPLGDLTIITVDQGTIALFEYNGQFKILGPGLHLIRDSMRFRNVIKLNNFYIKVGPEKWITIPDQYDGIALNNGKTVILEGGKQHHLFHENYKFVKLVPKTILTDRVVTDVNTYADNVTNCRGELPSMSGDMDPAFYLLTKTKDGAAINLDSMIFWQIVDTSKVARKAMNVMELRVPSVEDAENEQVHISNVPRNIFNLRKTVLQFAKAHLAEEVGHVCLTDDDLFFRDKLKSATKQTHSAATEFGDPNDMSLVTMNFTILNFLNDETTNLVSRMNEDLFEYGVHVSKLTINNALPTAEIQEQFDNQAKAKIERNTTLFHAENKRFVVVKNLRTEKTTNDAETLNKITGAQISKETRPSDAKGLFEKERSRARAKWDIADLQDTSVVG